MQALWFSKQVHYTVALLLAPVVVVVVAQLLLAPVSIVGVVIVSFENRLMCRQRNVVQSCTSSNDA